MKTRAPSMAAAVLGALVAFVPAARAEEAARPVSIRGRTLVLRVSGPPAGRPVVVASGDGGWVHLAPEVADMLSAMGWRVTGVDSKAYLSAFTEAATTLRPEDVPGDFAAFAAAAREGRSVRVLLAGVSEGAGLSVLAAADPARQDAVAGVLGLGLPEDNELAWRWRDASIWLTHKTPREPLFHASDYVPRLGRVPLAALHATGDEYVPLAEAQRLLSLPGGPKRLWVIEAPDHRFRGHLEEVRRRLAEAIAWIDAQPR